MNAAATTIFALAIRHTFLAARIAGKAHRMPHGVGREIVHLLGEVEVVFGLWAVPLMIAMALATGWDAAVHYLNDTVNYTEPLFVIVVMALASTRPIVTLQNWPSGGWPAWAAPRRRRGGWSSSSSDRCCSRSFSTVLCCRLAC